MCESVTRAEIKKKKGNRNEPEKIQMKMKEMIAIKYVKNYNIYDEIHLKCISKGINEKKVKEQRVGKEGRKKEKGKAAKNRRRNEWMQEKRELKCVCILVI